MPRAQKGQRFGGRAKGVPNKSTIERLQREKIAEQVAADLGKPEAARAIARVMSRNRVLAKDEIEDVIPILKGIVAKFQEPVMGAGVVLAESLKDDKGWSRFKDWLELYIETCFKLAEFQSPKYRAIAVVANPPDPAKSNDNVIRLNDPVGAARVYRTLIAKVSG